MIRDMLAVLRTLNWNIVEFEGGVSMEIMRRLVVIRFRVTEKFRKIRVCKTPRDKSVLGGKKGGLRKRKSKNFFSIH